MSKIQDWHSAKKRLFDAEKYVSIIGKTTTRSTVAEREGEHATAGSLVKFSVKTQMHFQPYDGAQNYHECSDFDRALSIVARKHWSELQAEALEYLRNEEREAAINARAEVEAQLALIDEAEAAREATDD